MVSYIVKGYRFPKHVNILGALLETQSLFVEGVCVLHVKATFLLFSNLNESN